VRDCLSNRCSNFRQRREECKRSNRISFFPLFPVGEHSTRNSALVGFACSSRELNGHLTIFSSDAKAAILTVSISIHIRIGAESNWSGAPWRSSGKYLEVGRVDLARHVDYNPHAFLGVRDRVIESAHHPVFARRKFASDRRTGFAV